MHPSRFALLRGPTIFRAPEDDQGSEYDEIDDPIDEVDEDPEDQEDEVEPDDPVDDLDEDEPPARQPSRGDNRVSAATKIAAEAKARADNLEREMAALRAQIASPAQPRETQAQINERLAQMEPWERTEYFRQQDAANFNATLQRIEFNAQESADKVAYDALSSRHPIAGKLKDEVEQRLTEMRKGGTTAPRETILKYLIGERALANAGRAGGKAKRSADANRDRQTTRPANGRGDTTAPDRRSGNASARDKRLENLQI